MVTYHKYIYNDLFLFWQIKSVLVFQQLNKWYCFGAICFCNCLKENDVGTPDDMTTFSSIHGFSRKLFVHLEQCLIYY